MKNLFAVILLKQKCKKALIERLDVGDRGAVVTFKDNTFPNPAGLIELLQKYPNAIKLGGDQKIRFMNLPVQQDMKFAEIGRLASIISSVI